MAKGRCKSGRADVGSESSAAGGRRSERSEWLRSKLGVSAVKPRRNFEHRKRGIGPYGSMARRWCGGGGHTLPQLACIDGISVDYVLLFFVGKRYILW